MGRPSEIRFGSFARVLGTPVYANEWWLARATDVELVGDAPSCHALADYMPACAAAARRTMPERVDAAWLREAMPVGLQVESPETPLPMGFVASTPRRHPAQRAPIAAMLKPRLRRPDKCARPRAREAGAR